MTSELDALSIDKVPYIVHAIKTEHSLGNKTMMHATDREIPMVIINITNDGMAVGRASIPVRYTSYDFRAKHLADAFIVEFNGKCIHDGTRYDNSVCDFRLNAKLVNDDQLNNVFKNVGQIIQKFIKP